MKKLLSLTLCILVILQLMPLSAHAADAEFTGDMQVYLTQCWLNQEYGDVEGFGTVPENGKTGTATVNGLLRALQHELGITSLANSFGPSTSSLYSQNLLTRQDGVTDNKFAILQGALWCKGYNPGYNMRQLPDGTVTFDKVFDETVEKAVIALKTDAGLKDPDGVVTLNVMKALMSMDAFKLAYGGDANIRAFQQRLNREYEEYIGLIPCDGVYGRTMNRALIYALQAEEKLPTDVANGNFGPTTRTHCPTIPYTKNEKTYSGEYYTDNEIAAVTEILNTALYVNGFGKDGITQNIVDFQKHMALPVTGKADLTTWLSLLLSSGDTSRASLAADTATALTTATAKTLFDNGYRYVGRYLTGGAKAVTKAEAQLIFEAGLKLFPIFQTTANYPEYFTPEKGTADGEAAISAATDLGLPLDTVIYFAVDTDAPDYQITNSVLPYFKSVFETVSKSAYKVGVYGTRNVCTRVSNKGFAVFSFVSDMSTQYSGNLGFKMPQNWAFDQFATVTVGEGSGEIEIDKNGYSGRDSAVGHLETYTLIDSAKQFSDIKPTAWYKPHVDYAVTHGIYSGTSDKTFEPNKNMTRAQFVQVFANLSGVDTSDRNVNSGFSDVPQGKWFTGAVTWAANNKIVSGIGDGKFDPSADVTRQQMCVMLVNYVENYKKTSLVKIKNPPTFADDKDIAKWANSQVYKCAAAGLVNGVGDNKFDPKSSATRAQGATIFTNFHKEYLAK